MPAPRTYPRRARLAHLATTALLMGSVALLAVLGERFHLRFDWSHAQRNTLSAASLGTLAAVPGPVRLTVYANEATLEGRVVADLLERYQAAKSDLDVEFVPPDLNPERVRALGISRVGTVDVDYQGRTQRVAQASEQTLTNALALVARSSKRQVHFLVGHGERNLRGQANHDLGTFGEHLTRRGFVLEPLSLLETGAVPADADMLVIAGPQAAMHADELALIQRYLERGGNLLVLIDPGPLHGLEALLQTLGVERLAGTLIDPATRSFAKFGLSNPTFVLVSRYGKHAVLDGFNLLTVLPGAAPLQIEPRDDWRPSALLRSGERVWAEAGEITGPIGFDAETEVRGPFDLAFALSRPARGRAGEQRAVVVSDGDFLSNAALGNSGNLDLGMRLFNWLAADDRLIDVAVRTDPDLAIELTRTQTAVLALGWLIAAPLTWLACGGVIWLRRRHR